MKTNFRPAYIKDFAACWKVIDQARQSMIESGRHQWTEEYPSEKDIRKDIENGLETWFAPRESAISMMSATCATCSNRLASRRL